MNEKNNNIEQKIWEKCCKKSNNRKIRKHTLKLSNKMNVYYVQK